LLEKCLERNVGPQDVVDEHAKHLIEHLAIDAPYFVQPNLYPTEMSERRRVPGCMLADPGIAKPRHLRFFVFEVFAHGGMERGQHIQNPAKVRHATAGAYTPTFVDDVEKQLVLLVDSAIAD